MFMEHFGLGEVILLFFFVIPAILWIIALVDILKNEFEGSNKLIWVLVVVLLPILGALLYLFIGRGQKIIPQK